MKEHFTAENLPFGDKFDLWRVLIGMGSLRFLAGPGLKSVKRL